MIWELIPPILYVLFCWWFSTGVIMYLNGLPAHTHKWTLLAATLLLALALLGLAATRDDTRITGAYLAFTCALMVWAWQEVAFLLGYVTGPRRIDCPPGASGWRRAGYAFLTLLHHELALLILMAAVFWATFGGSNRVGLSTYLIFWAMRLSAKLNLFLGVRNLNEQFLPHHLAYLKSYFRRRSMNGLFPFSVVASTWLAILVWQRAGEVGAGEFESIALTFLGTLLSLAILEHWFMMLPLPFEMLWNWGLRSRSAVQRRSARRRLT